MIINKKDIGDHQNLIGHIVLNSLANYPYILEKVARQGHAEIKMLVENQEVDLPNFIKYWQNQIQEMVDRAAERKISEKFGNVFELLQLLEQQTKDKIKNEE